MVIRVGAGPGAPREAIRVSQGDRTSQPWTPSAAFDSKEFRRACGQFLTGVTIVTLRAEDGTRVGITANSFTSASLDPPLVLVCVGKAIASYRAFRVGRACAIHVLGQDHMELSARFATRGADKFGGLPCRDGLGGAPLLPDYLALFECVITHAHDAGDHTIFIGHVQRIDVAEGERPPLGFFRGRYVQVQEEPSAVPLRLEGTDALIELWALGWA